MSTHDITEHPIHLGLGGAASVEPAFTGSMDWYADYEARHAKDGVEGRLVSMYSFTGPWSMWEMHPHGSEVVLCTRGRMTLHQQHPDGTRSAVTLDDSGSGSSTTDVSARGSPTSMTSTLRRGVSRGTESSSPTPGA